MMFALLNFVDPAEEIEFQTEFQMHAKFSKAIQKSSGVLDYTDSKITRLLKNTRDMKMGIMLLQLLREYREGKVAIAWRNGRPVYVNVGL